MSRQQFKLVDGNYGSVQIPEITGSMQRQPMVAGEGEDIEVKKNGYLYIYVSNESKGSVFFDNLAVTHIRGPVLEETHYYPFGSTMAEISSNSLSNAVINKLKYGSKEEQVLEWLDVSSLNLYDYEARYMDRQTGRWLNLDKMAESYYKTSPYSFIENSPVNGIDPDGNDVIFLNDTKGANISGNVNAGHAAVIIGNATDGWYYYSLNGTGDGQSPYADSKNPDVGTFLGYGSDIKKLITGENGANNVNPNEKHDYDKYVAIKTTREEDEAMKKKAEKAASAKKYIVVGQSCIDVAKKVYEELVHGRLGMRHHYLDMTLRNDVTPNTWFINLPRTFNNLNTYMLRWGVGNGDYFVPLKQMKATVIVGPLEKGDNFE